MEAKGKNKENNMCDNVKFQKNKANNKLQTNSLEVM